MPTQTAFSHPVLLLAGLMLVIGTAPGDEVKLKRRPAFRNVQIIDYTEGRLHFRGVSRQILRKPLEEVEWIRFDNLPELDQAEQPGRDYEQAVRIYRTLLTRTSEPWKRDLLRVRTVQAQVHIGFDLAVAGYLKLLSERVPGAAAARPSQPGPPGDPRHAAARARLRTARALGSLRAHHDDLLLLELELLLWDRVQPLPRPFRDWIAKAPAKTAAEPEPDAPAAMFADVPLEENTGVHLGEQSFAFEAVDEALDLRDLDAARARLDAVRPFCKPASPAVRLRDARIALQQDRPAAAVEALKSIADAHSGLPMGASATYYVGLAYARLEQVDLAHQAWLTLLQHRGADDDLRNLARAKLGLAAEE